MPYHPARVVFLINPKCANSSIKFALLQAQNKEIRNGVHASSETWSPAQVAASGYRAIGLSRNPYARAVSIWNSKIAKPGKSGLTKYPGFAPGQSFVEFLRAANRTGEYGEQHLRSQWIGMYHGKRFLPDRVLKIEDPQAWEKVQAEVPGLPALANRNSSNAPDWQEMCQGEAKALIQKRWARDFEVFGYAT
ncbi:MAG: sulfotransferase family 2 domain-containing protein [Pseudomonadota bacterium]